MAPAASGRRMIMDEVKDYPPYLDYPKPHKAKTNADRIRSMTDQELAVFLSRDLKQPCDYCQLVISDGACTETLCEDAMVKWLQQQAKGWQK